jgi:hypothetical protein
LKTGIARWAYIIANTVSNMYKRCPNAVKTLNVLNQKIVGAFIWENIVKWKRMFQIVYATTVCKEKSNSEKEYMLSELQD